MKLIVTMFMAVCCLTAVAVRAQSFTLTAPGNVIVNNGDTITLSGTTNDPDLFGHLELTNNSANSKSVMILKEHLSLVPLCDVVFQFGLYMYPPMIFLTPDGSNVAAGATDASFYTSYMHYGIPGISYVKYTFFDENNPADSAWMVYKFEIAQLIGFEESPDALRLNIYPNPSDDFITIQNRSAEPVSYTILDAVGVRIRQLTSHAQETQIDLGALPGGCYFIFAETENAHSREVYKVIKQ